MTMKKLFAVLAALVIALAAFAQTPEEILDKMEQVMDAHEAEGLIMTVNMKIPILGTMSTRGWTLGQKSKMVTTAMGVQIIIWTDESLGTTWTFDSKNNKIKIENLDLSKAKDDGGDAEMFTGVADGYDVSIKKETDKEWHILAKKQKTNQDKDAPKTMEVVVEKGTYYPLSLSAKMDGVTITMKDLVFGVTEADVTFNQANYPTATIEDKRQ